MHRSSINEIWSVSLDLNDNSRVLERTSLAEPDPLSGSARLRREERMREPPDDILQDATPPR